MSFKDHRFPKPKTVQQAEPTTAACAPWLLLLPDAAEGFLSEVEQRALDQHLLACPACAEELDAAHRGLAWLTMLKDQVPEPPLNLLSNILAQTTGMAETGAYLPERLPAAVPDAAMQAASMPHATVPTRSRLWQWIRAEQGTWSSLLQPRLAMTGAMAFLSICLTINLLGVSVTQLDAQTLHTGGLHRTVADTGASLIRSFQGLRVVYRVQSRVSEMRAQMNEPGKIQTSH